MAKEEGYSLGIDVGSTTVKAVLRDPNGKILYASYVRHFAKVRETSLEEIQKIRQQFGDLSVHFAFTGSAGLGLAERSDLPFVQEVQAAYTTMKRLYPQADAAIELGGEDAKIIFVTGGLEERMNGQCAGGTGAFIDQMATLLNVTLPEMDQMALKAEKAYPIASRCGVFAKSDVQSLLNQGASKEDVALSIFYAVADQTVAGLAQGREIKGHVLFLGGPLHFLKGLRKAFQQRLSLDDESAIFPEDADTFMAKGAALAALELPNTVPLSCLEDKLKNTPMNGAVMTGKPLFQDEQDYQNFLAAHKDFDIVRGDLKTYQGKAYLGIDAGSTTTKLVLLGEHNEILYDHYEANLGLPIDRIVNQLKIIYAEKNPRCEIVGSAVTGYGEDLIRTALHVDYGMVETVAHFQAAKYYEPDVNFVLDIGGQDIKCFNVKQGAIDSIMLNEACSSGCGSFLQTFAQSLGYDVETFAKMAYFAKHPVELGSRCTVFMNSSVKQAQREGASIEDISAGLCRSVVKNALYKVIRIHSASELGDKIVCQGGTFLNNAVLRSFEQEIGKTVIRPSIAGLMGAFGAALTAKRKGGEKGLIREEELQNFSYSSTHSTCHGCGAHCPLTFLRFPNGRIFLSGNKCDKPEGKKASSGELDIYLWKRERLMQLLPSPSSSIKVGIPMGLVMWEQLPFWDAFFKHLGWDTIVSPFSTRAMYRAGQKTIPSDTACYPAKLMHGHADYLLKQNPTFVFYPSESYNVNEKRGDNHFNCPVVAYYGELLKKNDIRFETTPLLDPFVDLSRPKKAIDTLEKTFKPYGVSKKDVRNAFDFAISMYESYRNDTQAKAKEIIDKARKEHKTIVVLAGRPYHVDPEVSHGIERLLDSLGVAVVSEDSLRYENAPKTHAHVLNQWTFHARLYDAANYVAQQPDMELVQLISFGCGIDAITSDEVRRILENQGKLYTGIKIDEINNLGAVRIRLRSLLAAVEEKHHES